jgi:glutathione synthase/RimK-type ligase-like ATP-grasp enzyme
MIIAIQPDDYGCADSSSPIWTRLLIELGHEVRTVNVYGADVIERLRDCHGFMWRHAHLPHMRQVAKRLLPVVEHELGLAVYPDQNTCWHYDDKIAQAYLLDAAGIPVPRTWVLFEKDAALDWVKTAKFPVVLKLWAGAGGSNVTLVRTADEAVDWVARLFGAGVEFLEEQNVKFSGRVRESLRIFGGKEQLHPWELHKNYVLFQEFLAGNEFDTRITVIGDRAFGFRRFNRANDFRASGSGIIDSSPHAIAPEMLRMAFDTCRKLKMQSCAIDGLWRGLEPVVGEVSYTYASWAVQDCPGYSDNDVNWLEGSMWPEEAQVADFLVRLRGKFGVG